MKHKQELIDILMADAKLRYQYADREGNTCAIGGLAAAFGWTPKPLKGSNRGKDLNATGVDALLKERSRASMMVPLKKAIEHFDLTITQVKSLQRVNDGWAEPWRHEMLEKEVMSWEEETE